MESLCILLEKYQPLLKQCDRMYAAAGESQQEQFQVLDKIIRHIRVKAEELEQIRSKEPQVKTPSQPVKQRGGKGGKGAKGAKGQSTRLCHNYTLTGKCSYGSSCKYKHEQLDAAAAKQARMTILAGSSMQELATDPEATMVGLSKAEKKAAKKEAYKQFQYDQLAKAAAAAEAADEGNTANACVHVYSDETALVGSAAQVTMLMTEGAHGATSATSGEKMRPTTTLAQKQQQCLLEAS